MLISPPRAGLTEAQPAGTETIAASRWLVPAIALGGTLAPLNSTMIAVALPEIRDAFGASLTATTVLVSAYLVVVAAAQPIGGRIGDLLGRRSVFLAGLAVFGLASVACALAVSLPMLIAGRLVQALAGAVAFPNGAAMIRETVPASVRGRAFGTLGMSFGIAAASGPPLGGLLVSAFGWAAMFWVSVPLTLLALLFGYRALPRTRPAMRRPATLDVPGGVLFAAALATVILIPTAMRTLGMEWAIAMIALAAGLGWAFVRREAGQDEPMVDLRLFRLPAFAWASLSVALSNLVMYTVLLSVPLYVSGVREGTVGQAGILLAILSVLSAATGPFGGRWSDRAGNRLPAVTGALVLVAGTVSIVIGVSAGSSVILGVGIAMLGLGLGISGAPVQAAALGVAPVTKAGMASGLYSTSRYLGSVVGSTVLAALFAGAAAGESAARFATLYAGLSVVACAGVYANAHIVRMPRGSGESAPFR